MLARLLAFAASLLSGGAFAAAAWTVSVDAREGLPAMSRGGAAAFSSAYAFWGPGWRWASQATALEVTGPFRYAARGRNALLDFDLGSRVRKSAERRLTWEFDLEPRRAADAVGGGIAFRFDLAAFGAELGQPELLPGNRGWSWGRPGGPRVEMRFEPALASVEADAARRELRLFFFKGEVPQGPLRYVATLEAAGGVTIGPSSAERFGLEDPAAWPAGIVDWRTSPVDLSFLNAAEKPAGRRGFVRVVNDRLVFADGTPARFWGTSLSGPALFGTTPENARQQARRLSALGFNLVRLHHHDSPWVRDNALSGAGALEKLDWWIKSLKDEGIYVWLDLHVERRLAAEDGIEGFEEIRKGGPTAELKGYAYVNASIRAAMKRFNERYAGRENRYTGVRYADEPAIVAMLLTNENDLTRHFGNALLPDRNVPRHSALYLREAEAFAAAHGLPKDKVWRSWEPGPSRLFLNDLEQRFNADLIGHLRSLGVKAPIVTTSTWGGNPLASLPALTSGGIVDVHAYGGAGELEKNPLYAPTLVHWMAAAQVAGKPLSVSEWNVERFPVPDRHAIPLYVAASARFQGWAAVLQYAYAQVPLNSPGGASNWHAFNDPALLGTLPAAALLYRRGDVRESARVYAFAPGKEALFGRALSPATSVALRTAAETGRLVIALPEAKELPWLARTPIPAEALLLSDPDAAFLDGDAAEALSDTGELRRNWDEGTYVVDTPRTQAAMGWIGGKRIRLADVELAVATRNATVAVQSLEPAPIGRSRAILVSLGARALPAQGNRLPFHAEPVQGELAIRAPEGLGLYHGERRLPAAYEDGRYRIRLEPRLETYWLVLRRP